MSRVFLAEVGVRETSWMAFHVTSRSYVVVDGVVIVVGVVGVFRDEFLELP